MRFIQTHLPGSFIIEPEFREDHRGYFARVFCEIEFDSQKLETNFIQCNISYNKKKGTLRGMHYQIEPYAEVKVIQCTSGSIYDTIIDLRPNSPTYTRCFSIELGASDKKMVYVPQGFAHGYQALEDNTEVLYYVSAIYKPESERGIRWNDPQLRLLWPIENPILSDKDQKYPDFIK